MSPAIPGDEHGRNVLLLWAPGAQGARAQFCPARGKLLPGWGHQRGVRGLCYTHCDFSVLPAQLLHAGSCTLLLPAGMLAFPGAHQHLHSCQGAPSVHPAPTPRACRYLCQLNTLSDPCSLYPSGCWVVPLSLLGHTRADTPEDLAGVAAG